MPLTRKSYRTSINSTARRPFFSPAAQRNPDATTTTTVMHGGVPVSVSFLSWNQDGAVVQREPAANDVERENPRLDHQLSDDEWLQVRAWQGPRRPGIGLAQWTSSSRRRGLFEHEYQGRVLGTDILFNMDAQIDYLVTELEANYNNVYNTITAEGITLNDASDDVVYRFEIPGAILDDDGNRRPREDANVQTVFERRRRNSERARNVYQNAE